MSLRASPVIIYLPQGLCGEGGKGEPIVEFVFLEVGKCDDQKACKRSDIVVLVYTIPNL